MYYMLYKELNSWVDSSLKYILQMHFLHYLFKNSIHKFSPWCPTISMTCIKAAESGWNREAKDLKKWTVPSTAGRVSSGGTRSLQRMSSLWCLVCEPVYHKFHCVHCHRQLSSAVTSACNVWSLISYILSLSGFSLFAEHLRQIVSVSSALWEVCHVSPFKQVV